MINDSDFYVGLCFMMTKAIVFYSQFSAITIETCNIDDHIIKLIYERFQSIIALLPVDHKACN